jgi:hypothetical protein
MTGEWKDKPINFKKKREKILSQLEKRKKEHVIQKKKVVESFGE